MMAGLGIAMQALHVRFMTARVLYRFACALMVALVFLGVQIPLHAQGTARVDNVFGGPVTKSKTHIQPELISEKRTVAPGETVTLAFVMQTQKGWHGYWRNPGDAGFGMEPEWSLPPDVTAGELQYPVPSTLFVGDLMNYVYKNTYAVLVPFTIGKNVAPGRPLAIAVKMEWLACTDKICVPEIGQFDIALDVAARPIPPTAAQMRIFDGYRTKLPALLDRKAAFAYKGNTVAIAIPYPETGKISAPYFFPVTENAFAYGQPLKTYRKGDMLIVEAAIADRSLSQIDGVLKIAPDFGLRVTAQKGDVALGGTLIANSGGPDDGAATTRETAGTAAPNLPQSAEKGGLLLFAGALGGAILGGLLLNIMPCVFPILSLKAISLARIGGDERAARREALAYAAGVIAVSLVLGGTLLGLRALGEQVGWAFQLQEPAIVIVLFMIVTAIAFNLAGLFEIGALSGGGRLAAKGGTSGALWTGALAAFVATPCTGPFMAAAMGTALFLPAYAALLVFAGLGLGLALPFLLLGYSPALRRWLPGPGAWMQTFRHIMAVPMFATGLALLWLLGQQSGSGAILTAVAAAMILALFLWWAGQRQCTGKPVIWLILPPAVIVTATAIYALPAQTDAGPASAAASDSASDTLPSERFSTAKLETLRRQGRPVFAYFTADWCITCKVNEAGVLQRADTAAAFKQANVAVLKGDWTRRDPEITRFLSAHGRSGVPFYIYYPAKGEPRILPQILTPGILSELVQS